MVKNAGGFASVSLKVSSFLGLPLNNPPNCIKWVSSGTPPDAVKMEASLVC